MGYTVRIAALQPKTPIIDFHIQDAGQAMECVEENLNAMAELILRAGKEGCDAVALTEDTTGLHKWLAAHSEQRFQVLPGLVERMLDRLGEAAGEAGTYLICCSDNLEDGDVYNTAFLLGRDGREIGRYRKVNMPYSELGERRRGPDFPVFETPDLDGVGMLICYDMVFPEAIRCLALGGADVVFVPTMGGAAMGGATMGDIEMSRAAFRVRAVDSFVYLVVAYRASGSMVISPQGEILAEGSEEIVYADVDLFGGRQGGNAYDWQEDMRVRLFRERAPEAYGVLVDPEPPALAKLPAKDTPEEVTRRANGVLTVGTDRFAAAEGLMREGKVEEAVKAFEELQRDFPGSWIDRQAEERLKGLRKELDRG